MTSQIKLPYPLEWSTDLPHVARVDLFDNNIGQDVVVMAIDQTNGDLHYIRVDYLDEIDKKRILQILSSQSTRGLPLWEAMYHKTLPNGQNALEFFDQFAMIKTIGGQHMRRSSGRRGISTSFQAQSMAAQQYPQAAPVQAVDTAQVVTEGTHDSAWPPAAQAPVAAPKKAGRPPKSR